MFGFGLAQLCLNVCRSVKKILSKMPIHVYRVKCIYTKCDVFNQIFLCSCQFHDAFSSSKMQVSVSFKCVVFRLNHQVSATQGFTYGKWCLRFEIVRVSSCPEKMKIIEDLTIMAWVMQFYDERCGFCKLLAKIKSINNKY